MTYWQGFLAILGGIAALVALCMAVIRGEKRKESGEYDERQRQAQGNAYRLSFNVGFFYFIGLFGALKCNVFRTVSGTQQALSKY